MSSAWLLLLVTAASATGSSFTFSNSSRNNVLFIVVDDMRPSIGAYNYTHAHTPYMDTFASSALTFTRAYVNYAYCSPSRNSFMTGRRPDTTRVWEFIDHFREPGVGADWVSLPQYFKRHGYLTLGSGKLFHPSSSKENIGMPNNDYPASWSPEYPYFDNQPPNDPHRCLNPMSTGERTGKGQQTFCIADVGKDDIVLSDQKIRESCLSHIKLAASKISAPKGNYSNFFVGCGLHKPHVPWVVPKEFYESLPIKKWQDYPLAADQFAPVGMPQAAWHPPADVGGMQESPSFNGTSNNTRARLYRRAYDAAISYQDYNIGRLLTALDDNGLSKSTVVIIFGDHGWQLGEHDTWAKMTNFELATHIPLIVRAPRNTNPGTKSSALVEAVDIYPSLVELAGLPPPSSLGQQLNGTSFAAQLLKPSSAHFKDAAFSQFAKVGLMDVNPRFYRNQTELMGYTVRVDNWRYTCWFSFDKIKLVPNTLDILGRELYDHHDDFGLWLDFGGENVNLVDQVEHKEVVGALHKRILDYIQLKPVIN